MDVINLAPSAIRYSQDSISNTFGDSTNHAGQYIGETLDEIVSNPNTANLIPNISVFNKDDKWFTLDNRRLWVFKRAEELGIVRSIDVYVTYGIDDSKFTTTSDGKYVRVRRNNPGGHLWQSLQRKIEKQAREGRRGEEKKQRERERERPRREREQEREREQQRKEREQEREREQQRKKREQERERERQRREKEQDMEIERQRREREQMKIDQQGGVNIIDIVIGLIVSSILVYLGMRHHRSN
jgi:hypothetical protein